MKRMFAAGVTVALLTSPIHAESPVINLPNMPSVNTAKDSEGSRLPGGYQAPPGQQMPIESPRGRTDIDPYAPWKPEPALAVANGVFIPGGGWFYLAMHEEKPGHHTLVGAGFLAASLLVVSSLFDSLKHHKNGDANLALVSLLVIRWADVSLSAGAAVDSRGP